MADFLAGLSRHACRPGGARPLVVHADELQPLPAGEVHNPTALSVVGNLPTATFELFRQTIPPALSSDMQRHHHETVHFVIAGDGPQRDRGRDRRRGRPASFVYTPPWTWHRHYNDSTEHPVEFLTIENSRLLGAARA